MATNRRLRTTPLALAVLTLLYERSMHPYEMRTLMQERGHDQVIPLKGGSLYDTVERLRRLGLIEPLETSREGRRPERTTYAITDVGREELKAWLRELIAEPAQEYPRFAAGLAFMLALESKDEAARLLRRRAKALDGQIAAREREMSQTFEYEQVPRIVLIEGEYLQAVRRAELEWVRQTAREIEEGDLWPDAEMWNRLLEMGARTLEAHRAREGGEEGLK